jgi:hypothetical protein
MKVPNITKEVQKYQGKAEEMKQVLERFMNLELPQVVFG